jgi:hypothetical protein
VKTFASRRSDAPTTLSAAGGAAAGAGVPGGFVAVAAVFAFGGVATGAPVDSAGMATRGADAGGFLAVSPAGFSCDRVAESVAVVSTPIFVESAAAGCDGFVIITFAPVDAPAEMTNVATKTIAGFICPPSLDHHWLRDE